MTGKPVATPQAWGPGRPRPRRTPMTDTITPPRTPAELGADLARLEARIRDKAKLLGPGFVLRVSVKGITNATGLSSRRARRLADQAAEFGYLNRVIRRGRYVYSVLEASRELLPDHVAPTPADPGYPAYQESGTMTLAQLGALGSRGAEDYPEELLEPQDRETTASNTSPGNGRRGPDVDAPEKEFDR